MKKSEILESSLEKMEDLRHKEAEAKNHYIFLLIK